MLLKTTLTTNNNLLLSLKRKGRKKLISFCPLCWCRSYLARMPICAQNCSWPSPPLQHQQLSIKWRLLLGGWKWNRYLSGLIASRTVNFITGKLVTTLVTLKPEQSASLKTEKPTTPNSVSAKTTPGHHWHHTFLLPYQHWIKQKCENWNLQQPLNHLINKNKNRFIGYNKNKITSNKSILWNFWVLHFFFHVSKRIGLYIFSFSLLFLHSISI